MGKGLQVHRGQRDTHRDRGVGRRVEGRGRESKRAREGAREEEEEKIKWALKSYGRVWHFICETGVGKGKGPVEEEK